jgi:hypothetical protein
MEVIVQVALLFLFIQFLVVMTIMTVALLLAREEVAGLGRAPGHRSLRRSFAAFIHLPGRVVRYAARRLNAAHGLRPDRQ